MKEIVKPSLCILLNHAVRVVEKAEQNAINNLLKGTTDTVMDLVTIRQLTGLIIQIKDQLNGSRENNAESKDFNYPNW